MKVTHAGRERLLIQLCRESGEKGLKYKSHVEKITPGLSSEAPQSAQNREENREGKRNCLEERGSR